MYTEICVKYIIIIIIIYQTVNKAVRQKDRKGKGQTESQDKRDKTGRQADRKVNKKREKQTERQDKEIEEQSDRYAASRDRAAYGALP